MMMGELMDDTDEGLIIEMDVKGIMRGERQPLIVR